MDSVETFFSVKPAMNPTTAYIMQWNPRGAKLRKSTRSPPANPEILPFQASRLQGYKNDNHQDEIGNDVVYGDERQDRGLKQYGNGYYQNIDHKRFDHATPPPERTRIPPGSYQLSDQG